MKHHYFGIYLVGCLVLIQAVQTRDYRKESDEEDGSVRLEQATLGWWKKISCTISSRDPCFWVHGANTTREKAANSNYEIIKTKSSCDLEITEVRVQDEGLWSCVSGKGQVSLVELQVIVPPLPYLMHDGQFLWPDDSHAVTPNNAGEVTLMCVAEEGFPKPEAIEWTVDGKDVEPSTDMAIIPESNGMVTASSQLVISFKEGSCPQGKVVTCHVRHNAYTNLVESVSNVIGQPAPTTKAELVHPFHAPFVGEGQTTVTLECKTNGIPSPDYIKFMWIDLERDIVEEVGYEPTLTARNPGQYYCVVSNKLPNGVVTWAVSNNVTLHNHALPQNTRRVYENASLRLPCRIESKKDACFWLHGNVPIFSNKPASRSGYKIQYQPKRGLCDLEIKRVTLDDIGVWQCVITTTQKPNLVYFVMFEDFYFLDEDDFEDPDEHQYDLRKRRKI